MDKIITAEEFMLENLQSMDMSEVENAMIEFAKMHVKLALKAGSENLQQAAGTFNSDYNSQKRSILNAYPLDNIK